MSSLHRLRVSFARVCDLTAGIRPGLSRTRIFAATEEELPVGTRVRLEIGLAGNPPAIRGVAKVSGDSESWPQETPVPGLFLDVVHLDPPSTRFVDRVLRGEPVADTAGQTRRHGPFEVVADASTEREVLPGPGLVIPEPPVRRRPYGWVAAAAVALAAALLVFFFYPRHDDGLLTGDQRSTVADTVETTVAIVEQPAPDEIELENDTVESATADSEPATSDQPAPPVLDREGIAEEVERVALAWAAAWSEQNADDYLSLYAPSYSPPDLTRDVWESQRRARIRAPESIEVSLSELDVEVADATHAVARFLQYYRAGDKNLAARKALDLERLDGEWRIVGERVAPAP
ncbi:MAG: hypothetical protein GY719_21230 [bacterium]|nr:hypothetical protein [bacterium]